MEGGAGGNRLRLYAVSPCMKSRGVDAKRGVVIVEKQRNPSSVGLPSAGRAVVAGVVEQNRCSVVLSILPSLIGRASVELQGNAGCRMREGVRHAVKLSGR